MGVGSWPLGVGSWPLVGTDAVGSRRPMSAPYQDIVAQLRFAFPKPVSDRMHDAYFVFSFLRALDQVDALKSAAPMLGAPIVALKLYILSPFSEDVHVADVLESIWQARRDVAAEPLRG